MNKTIGYSSLVVFFGAGMALAACQPQWVSDQNSFLAGFVNHELLSVLGVILALTLGSIANIHLEFNRLEERYNAVFLNKSRANLRKNAYWLISLFVAAIVIVVVKPIASQGAASQGVFNVLAMLVVLWHILILISLSDLVFAMIADVRGDEPPKPQ
ncbi:hypothetical protein ACIKTA_08525 [Hansschlegelia beijingensis]